MPINRAHPLVQKIDRFLYSPAYFLLVGGLTVLSNVFSLEIFVYTAIILLSLYICLFSRDLLPLFPLFVCGYISPSAGNNPGVNDNSIFSLSGGGLYLIIALIPVAICLVFRLMTDPDFGGRQFLTKKRSLLSGMLVLSLTYALSGLGSGQWTQYGWRNLLFAFVQFLAITGLYYLLSGAVKWEQAPRAYLFWTGLCVGYVLLAELIGIYLQSDVIVNGAILRGRIVTGWGHYNNIGALFAIIIPLPFFLTGKGKYAVFAYISAFLFFVGLLFTCSRTSILFGIVMYILSYVLSMIHSKHARRQIGMHIAILVLLIAVVVVFRKQLLWLFRDLVDTGFDSMVDRRRDYLAGLKQFAQFPVFGGSFFPVDHWPYAWSSAESFLKLFPPRWHNTFVQLLATGGVACFAGYGFHRVQTVKLFVKHFTTEKLFAGLSVLALLLTSMLDCHFFNLGPVLLYSGLLAIVECQLDQIEHL